MITFKQALVNFIADELGGNWKSYYFQGSTLLYIRFRFSDKNVTLSDYEIKEKVARFANLDEDNIRVHRTELGSIFVYNANKIGFVKSTSDGTISWKNL